MLLVLERPGCGKALEIFLEVDELIVCYLIFFMNSVASFSSSTTEKSFSLEISKSIGCNALRMWHLDPKEKLKPLFFPLKLSTILLRKHLGER